MNGSRLEQFELCDGPNYEAKSFPVSVVTAAQASDHPRRVSSGRQLRDEATVLRDRHSRIVHGLIAIIGHDPRYVQAADFAIEQASQDYFGLKEGDLGVQHWPIRRHGTDLGVVGIALPKEASIADIAKVRRALLNVFDSVTIEMSMRRT